MNPSTWQEDKAELTQCLYMLPYDKLNFASGAPKQYLIEAGKCLSFVVEVDLPRSIVSVQFQTEEYDIQFGFFRARDTESIYLIQNEGEENESIVHPRDRMEVVFPLQVIESSDSMVKITFIAKEEGFYQILFSNEHSWMRSKTLKFRYAVLRPVLHDDEDDEEPEQAPKQPVEYNGYIFNNPEQKLRVKFDDSKAELKVDRSKDQIVEAYFTEELQTTEESGLMSDV